MKPAPGWVLVMPVEHADTYAGSALQIPETAKRTVARNQVEILALPTHGEPCDDPDCSVAHLDGCHLVPRSLRTGDWCVIRPRSLLAIPNDPAGFLVRIDDVQAILRA